MDEEEFDALLQGRPFGTADAKKIDERLRRCTTLGRALWGKTSEDLQRQLLSPYPEIPSGFALSDFRELQRRTLELSALLNDPRSAWASRLGLSSQIVSVGSRQYTSWEARCEIVRRAIEYLEKK
jgi:hypothetical protein